MSLSKQEARLIAGFLGHLCERFGNDGCNDMTLEDTPENRKLIAASEADELEKHGDANYYAVEPGGDGNLHTSNTATLHHLLDRFLQEYGLTKADVPDVNATPCE